MYIAITINTGVHDFFDIVFPYMIKFLLDTKNGQICLMTSYNIYDR